VLWGSITPLRFLSLMHSCIQQTRQGTAQGEHTGSHQVRLLVATSELPHRPVYKAGLNIIISMSNSTPPPKCM
jgi:hypothetical protein